MSKHIRTHNAASDGHQDDANFDWYFPYFVFALRDFSLQLVLNGRQVTADEYMEHCLRLQNGEEKRVQAHNAPRLCIRKYFKKRFCFTFDRPASRRSLPQLEQLPDDKLSEDFVEEMSEFVNFVFKCAPVKKLELGQKINGRSKCR